MRFLMVVVVVDRFTMLYDDFTTSYIIVVVVVVVVVVDRLDGCPAVHELRTGQGYGNFCSRGGKDDGFCGSLLPVGR